MAIQFSGRVSKYDKLSNSRWDIEDDDDGNFPELTLEDDRLKKRES